MDSKPLRSCVGRSFVDIFNAVLASLCQDKPNLARKVARQDAKVSKCHYTSGNSSKLHRSFYRNLREEHYNRHHSWFNSSRVAGCLYYFLL